MSKYGFKDSTTRKTKKLEDWFKNYKKKIIFFSKQIKKTSNSGVWGVYPKAMDWNFALHTQILIWASISEVGSQKHFKKGGHSYRCLALRRFYKSHLI